MKRTALNAGHQKMIAVASACLILYLAWTLSFEPTWCAWLLNRELNTSRNADEQDRHAFKQVEGEHLFYAGVLKAYQVKREERENRVWQAVSALALQEGVELSYAPPVFLSPDSNAVKAGLFKTAFKFKGDFVSLVKLADTLGELRGVGKISAIKMSSKPAPGAVKKDQLVLELTISGIER